MHFQINATSLRSILLAAFALVLIALILRRFTVPTPVLAETDSAAAGVHLIPNDRDQLVIYDSGSRRILSFAVVNGTDLRLRGWRDAKDDPRVWDSSLLKGTFAGIENKNGSNMDFMRPSPDPRVGSMMATQADQRKKNDVQLFGIAGE